MSLKGLALLVVCASAAVVGAAVWLRTDAAPPSCSVAAIWRGSHALPGQASVLRCFVQAEQTHNIDLLWPLVDPTYQVSERQLLSARQLGSGPPVITLYNDPKVGDYAPVTIRWPSGLRSHPNLDIPDPQSTRWAIEIGKSSETVPTMTTGPKVRSRAR